MPVRYLNGSLILFTVLFGCGAIPPIDEYFDGVIGTPIDTIQTIDAHPTSYAGRVGWTEVTYTLENGNWVYIHPDSPGCQIHFEVDPDGIIVGYRPVGVYCR